MGCGRRERAPRAQLAAGSPTPLAVLAAHGDGDGKEVSNKQVVTVLAHDGASATLFSGGWDQTVRVWPPRPAGAPASAAERPAALEHGQAVLALAVLVDGRLASGAGDGKIVVWQRGDAPGAPFAASPTARSTAWCVAWRR